MNGVLININMGCIETITSTGINAANGININMGCIETNSYKMELESDDR